MCKLSMYERTGSMVAFYKSQVRTRFQATLFLIPLRLSFLRMHLCAWRLDLLRFIPSDTKDAARHHG